MTFCKPHKPLKRTGFVFLCSLYPAEAPREGFLCHAPLTQTGSCGLPPKASWLSLGEPSQERDGAGQVGIPDPQQTAAAARRFSARLPGFGNSHAALRALRAELLAVSPQAQPEILQHSATGSRSVRDPVPPGVPGITCPAWSFPYALSTFEPNGKTLMFSLRPERAAQQGRICAAENPSALQSKLYDAAADSANS